jgi:GNAT superfamily N-acetyltransferase
VTRELSKETLPDYERFFEKHPAPGAYICWCMFHQRPDSPDYKNQTRAQIVAENKKTKRKLVSEGRSHGILVYKEGEPVGWCQFGSNEELPRMQHHPQYRKLALNDARYGKKFWRITCFTVEKKYRRTRVASVALKAALEAIRKRGGGLVEAYPIKRYGSYREYLGIASMFEREGFEKVAPFGRNNVVMRKMIKP